MTNRAMASKMKFVIENPNDNENFKKLVEFARFAFGIQASLESAATEGQRKVEQKEEQAIVAKKSRQIMDNTTALNQEAVQIEQQRQARLLQEEKEKETERVQAREAEEQRREAELARETRIQQDLARSYVRPNSGAAGQPFVENIEQFDPANPEVMTRRPTLEQQRSVPAYLDPTQPFAPKLPTNIAASIIDEKKQASERRAVQKRMVDAGVPVDVAFNMTAVDVDKRVRSGDRVLAEERPEVKALEQKTERKTDRGGQAERLRSMINAVSTRAPRFNLQRITQFPEISRSRSVNIRTLSDALGSVGLRDLEAEAVRAMDVMLSRLNREQMIYERKEQTTELSPNVREYTSILPYIVMLGLVGANRARQAIKGVGGFFPSARDESSVLALRLFNCSVFRFSKTRRWNRSGVRRIQRREKRTRSRARGRTRKRTRRTKRHSPSPH